MNLWKKGIVMVSLMIGGGLFAGMPERGVVGQEPTPTPTSLPQTPPQPQTGCHVPTNEDGKPNLLVIHHGGETGEQVALDKKQDPGAFTTPDLLMKLVLCPPPKSSGPTQPPVHLSVTGKVKLLDQDEQTEVTQCDFYPDKHIPLQGRTFWVKATQPSQQLRDIKICASFLRECQDTVKATAVDLDLDIDTNMDGNPNNDDAIEMDPCAIIVNVNNDSDAGSGIIDDQNAIIDGSEDKKELTSLWLRQIKVMPDGYKVVLSISGPAKLRIFDETETAIIGPDESWGGPPKREFLVPNDKITAGDLKYLVEGCDYGSTYIRLTLLDGRDKVIAEDAVNVEVNVDRMPANNNDFYRNYVGTLLQTANLEGIEAKLEGSKPLVSWGRLREEVTSTSFWVNIGDNIRNAWLQTGNVVERRQNGSERDFIYVEFVSDFLGFIYNVNPDGYLRYEKRESKWSNGKFKIEITDRAIGEAQVFFDEESWKKVILPKFQTAALSNYQIQTEPKQTVSRVPGTVFNRARVSEARFKDNTGWHDTNFSANDLRITVINGKGERHSEGKVTYDNSGSFFEYNFNWLTGQSFEIWDNRSW